MESPAPYLAVSFLLFCMGLFTILARKNVVAILLGLELVLNAAALNFAAYARFGNLGLDGHVMSLLIIVVAAAEAAVGLAIVIRFHQTRESVHVDDATQLRN